MEVIEQERIRRRFSQAVNTYDDHAEAQKRICAHLVQLLTVYTSSHFRRVETCAAQPYPQPDPR